MSLNIGELTGVIDLDSGKAEQSLSSVHTALKEVAGTSTEVKVDADTAAAETALGRVESDARTVDGITASVQATADTGDAEGGLGRVKTEAASLDGKSVKIPVDADTGPAEQEMRGIGSKLATIGKAAGAAAGAAIGGALALGIGNAMNFESANAKLAAQLGGSAEHAAEMGKIAGDLYSGAWGESLDQVNQALLSVVQHGAIVEDASKQQIQSITASVLDLATAFGQDVTAAGAAVGQMMRNGLAPDAETALDVITRGFQQGADKAGDFLDTITEYGTQFRKLGLDGATATGLISQGLQAGARDADKVADAIKEFSIRAIDGSKSTAQGFSAIGLSASDMAGKIAAGGPTAAAALDLTLDRLRSIEDPVKRDAAAVALFGTQAEDMGAALYALDPSTAVDALGNVEGAAKKMGDTLNDTAAVKIEAVKRGFEQWSASMVEIPGPIGDVAAGVIAFGGSALSMAGNIAMLALAGGPLLGMLKGIPALLMGILPAIRAVTAAMMANPIGLIIGIIAILVVFIITHWEEVKNVTIAVWNAIWAFIEPIVTNIVNFITLAWTALQMAWTTVWNGIVTVVTTVWNAIWTVIEPIVTIILNIIKVALAIILAIFFTVWNAVYAVVTTVWNAIWGFLEPIVTAIVEWITNAWNTAWAVTEQVWNAIWDVIQTVWNAIWGFLEPIITAIVDTVSTAWNAIVAAVSGALDAVWGVISSVLSTIADFFRQVWESDIVQAVVGGIANVINTITGFVSWIMGLAGQAIGWLLDAGRNLVTGLWNGIASMGTWLYNQILGWIKSVVPGPVLQFLGIASPSKWAEQEVGRWIPAGLAKGITGNTGTITSAMQTVNAAIADNVPDTIGTQLDARTSLAGRGGDGADMSDTGGTVNVNVYNPLAERTSDTIARKARTITELGAFAGV